MLIIAVALMLSGLIITCAGVTVKRRADTAEKVSAGRGIILSGILFMLAGLLFALLNSDGLFASVAAAIILITLAALKLYSVFTQ